MRATFLGVSTILLDDGETAIMTDGFFSRPSLLRTQVRPIGPDEPVITECLNRAGVRHLAAVLVAHSHYDHAMDSPSVARRTGAVMVGSRSTALIGEGYGLPPEQTRVVGFGETLRFGAFEVTALPAEHTPKPRYVGHIGHPVRPPASIRAYRMGECYSFHVRHPEGSLIVHASTNFVPGAHAAHQADVVYLGVATLGRQSESFRRDYWQAMVRDTGVRRVVPIHWDNFFKPLNRPLVPLPRLADNFDATLEFLRSHPETDLHVPSAWETIDPFA
jgi:L-ascorbate metabolism protein UlaG (beta-lactamase superfamily)